MNVDVGRRAMRELSPLTNDKCATPTPHASNQASSYRRSPDVSYANGRKGRVEGATTYSVRFVI